MKQKCTFILKASTALVLALLMLFGTMATSLAAVVENADTGAKAELAETGGYNWYGNIYFRVPDGWDLSTRPYVYLMFQENNSSTTANSNCWKTYYRLTNMAGTTANSRLYGCYIGQDHSGYGKEYLGFVATNSSTAPSSNHNSISSQFTNYTSLIDYGFSNNSGAYYFGPTNQTQNAKASGNTISGSYNGDRATVIKAGNQTAKSRIDAANSDSTTGGTVKVGGYYPHATNYFGSDAIVSGETSTGSSEQYNVVQGTKVTMTAAPSANYRFLGWYDGNNSSTATRLSTNLAYTYYALGTKTAYALFKIKPQLTIAQRDTNSNTLTGTVTIDSTAGTSAYVMPSTNVAIDITAPGGYTISTVSGANWSATDTSSSTHWTGTANITSNATLTITYAEITAGIALTAYTDGEASTTGGHIEDASGNTITSLSGIGVTTKGTAVSVVTAGGDYAFSGWSKSGANASHIKIYTNATCTTLYTGSESPQPTTVYIKTDGTSGMTTANSIVIANFVLANRSVTVGKMLDTDGTGYSVARAASDGISPDLDGDGTYSVTDEDEFTVSTTAVSGYKFMGWMISDSVETTAAADYTPDDTDLSNSYTMSASIKTHYYALYRKEYYVTVYNSYVDNDNGVGFHKIAAPPTKVTTTTPENVTTTYTYVYNASTAGEDTTVSSTGNFNEGNKLTIVAGDTVKLYYSKLSSSDAISGVFFNNARRYTTEDQPDHMYTNGVNVGAGNGTDDDWDYTYEAETTLFADERYYTAEDVLPAGTDAARHSAGDLVTEVIEDEYANYATNDGTPGNGVDQDAHVVTWTAKQNYRNIDLELATKYRIYFSDTAKIEVTSETTDNYYNIEQDITNLKVNARTSSTSTNTITKSSITFWVADENGAKTESQITDTSIIDKGGATTSTGPSQLITFSGEMPAYNIYVDLGVVTSYMVGVGSKCMASPNEGFTDLITASGGNPKLGTITTSPSVANNTTGTKVNDGSSVTYTFAWNNSWNNYYMFLGWYESAVNASTPDFKKARLSTELSFSYTPKKNVRIWAVATRCFFIGGGFTQNATTKQITYSGSSWDNRYEMEYDPSWVNPDNGNVEGRYYFEFPNAPTTDAYVYFRCYDMATGNNQLSFWNQMCGEEGDGKAWHNDNADLFYGHEAGWDDNAKWDSYFSKNTNGAGYFKLTSTNVSNGYGASIYVYFYPRSSSGTGISANSTFQWINCYISGGYNSINASSNTYPTITAGPSTTIGGPEGGGWTPTNETVKHYQIKTKNGGITIAKTVAAGYKVSAYVVYDINSKKAYSVKGDAITYSNSDRTATATIKPTGDCYICPVIESTSATATVYVRTSDLNMDNWGALVSMYTWAGSEGAETNKNYGNFPGQLMIPSNDGESWYASVDASTMSGMLFCNYYQGTWFTDATTIKNSDGTAIPTAYNTGQRVRQTFDYREPEALYINQSNNLGVKRMMYFALKDGNTNTTTTAYATLTSTITLGSYSWEYLTNYDGTKYVDLNGQEIETEPTATYYVIAQGDAYYENSGFYPDTRLNTKGGTKRYDYPAVNNYNGKRSVQWYVYDSTGRYLFNTLSAGLADQDEDDGISLIASILEGRGEPYVGKSVKICYDTPVDYGDGQVIRYSGQWYAQDITKKVTANVEIGVCSNGNYTLQGTPQVSGLGTALVKYTGTNSGVATAGTTSLTASVGGVSQSGYNSYKVPLYDAALSPLTLYATEDNFLGWYVYNEDDDEYERLSTDPSLQINFNSDVTYYAMYQAKAIYKYQYTGRRGTVEYTVASQTDMTSAEIANNQTPNSTNRSAEIASLAPNISDVSVFNKDLTFTFGTVTRTAPFTLTITGTSAVNHSYTLTVKEPDNSTTLTTLSGSTNTSLDLPQAKMDVINNYARTNNKYFVGWYDDPTDGKLISVQRNFGMSVTMDMTVYPRFADTARTPITGFDPYVDRNEISRELTGKGSGTYYNDSIVRFQGEMDAAATPANCGILIVYQDNTATAMGSFTEENLTTIATNLRLEDNAGKVARISSKNARAFNITCTSLNNFNRADLVYVSDYAGFVGKTYEVYAYYYDGSSYHFSSVTSGSYAV